jgi:hypothetical protein
MISDHVFGSEEWPREHVLPMHRHAFAFQRDNIKMLGVVDHSNMAFG